MFKRPAENLLSGRWHIPLRCFAFAARRCPPSKGESRVAITEINNQPSSKPAGFSLLQAHQRLTRSLHHFNSVTVCVFTNDDPTTRIKYNPLGNPDPSIRTTCI